MPILFDECLNCSAIWGVGTEEYENQQCDSCGWTPGAPFDDKDEHEDFLDGIDED